MNLIETISKKLADRFGYVKRDQIATLISSYYSGQAASGVQPTWEWSKLVDAYKGWVYTCIDRIAKDVASIPQRLFIYRRTGKKIVDGNLFHYLHTIDTKAERKYYLKQVDLEQVEITEHPYLDVTNRPNIMMYRFTFWYNIMIRLELGGMCCLYTPGNKILKIPREVWPLPLTKYASIRAIPDKQEILKGWFYQDGDIRQTFLPSEIIPLMYPSPVSIYEGMSPLMAQVYPYDIDLYLQKQQKSLFENQAIVDDLTTDQQLTQAQRDEILTYLRDTYSGPDNAGKTRLLHSGLKSSPRGQTGREAMIRDVADWVSERLISAYDMSKGKLGIVEDVNRANAEALDHTHMQECIKPRCMLLSEGIEAFWLPKYDTGLSIEFDLPDTGDKQFRLTERQTNLNTYYSTINEEREKEGKEPKPWGDIPWIPFNYVQPGKTSPVPPANEPQKAISLWEMKLLNEDFWTDDRKDIYWKAFVGRTDHWESLIIKPLQSYWKGQLDDVITRLMREGRRVEGRIAGWHRTKVERHLAENGRKDLNDININAEEEAKRLKILFNPTISYIAEQAALSRLRELGAGIGFNMNDPRVLEWIGSRLDKFSQEVSGTTFDTIKAIIRDGFTEGQPLSVIGDTLREKFDSWDKYRAPLIARTETLAASNWADLEGVKQSGLDEELNKFWLSARDGACRPTHLAADLKYRKGISIDREFDVGQDNMMVPGGGSKPEENINCRCVLGYLEKK
jgi:phage portal protein BeeE